MNNQPWTDDQMFQMGIVKVGGDAVKVEEPKEEDNGDQQSGD
jgi:hypothetical protein